MASDYTANGFGAIDENNRGCLFPATGWNHSYAVVLNEPVPEEDGGGNEISNQILGQISVPEATQEKVNEIVSNYSFAQIAIVGSATLAPFCYWYLEVVKVLNNPFQNPLLNAKAQKFMAETKLPVLTIVLNF